MSEIQDEIVTGKRSKREKGFSFLQVFVMIAIVLMAAVYMGETLFGKNSLDVLLSLQQQQKILDRKIKYISHQNAALQREYFELNVVLNQPDANTHEETPQR